MKKMGKKESRLPSPAGSPPPLLLQMPFLALSEPLGGERGPGAPWIVKSFSGCPCAVVLSHVPFAKPLREMIGCGVHAKIALHLHIFGG